MSLRAQVFYSIKKLHDGPQRAWAIKVEDGSTMLFDDKESAESAMAYLIQGFDDGYKDKA